ncbi:MAG: chromosome segregation protein SMC [Reyranella sp.]|jgi:chromosome segregation protein|uniref:chromosome segregation protein SMC n=1 Tax=Reyranella sp. TaxID=1929291 RepID=UPI00095BD8E3|nr:chromosome segregation protein SMC [Reyranella sp.]MBN9539047.1 chromosome segregation protein SMC [Alphaproteobacteria bacterium]MBR2820180.1 chromosome segregation protein SMC [Reyranella sp.]OJU33704.1 MAG: chromosome segregation protein SMC [Alphaproteobacteria bacterium 65-37]
MVQFDKLRLAGFKSFVDPTELVIEAGMTGIVGPNGCGKSNLVEALKWVMGETSAKQMRGSEMEDVIFAGAGTRPARNIAEVTLSLDNKTRTAPAMVNDSDQLDIARRIERGHGSAYTVNGREIRARDVQTLFADAATGSRSTALVSQGRIGTLINAKPADRRTIIDEAAGITGLYARRHEAELRLRAAEQNLARVQDVLVALEEQHKGLKRQARQASRYRNLSDHIRRAEATVLALKLANAERELAESAERLKETEAQVADLTRLVGLATTAQAEAATALPPLRNDEASAAAALQRLRVAHDALTAEAERVAAAQHEAETRLQQTEQDLAREQGRKGDAETAIADLDSQRTRLEEEQVGEEDRAEAAQEARDTAQAETSTAETEHDQLTRQIAADEALRQSVGRELSELQDRLRRLTVRRDEVAAQQQQLEAELAGLPALPEVEEALEAARVALEEARYTGQEAIEAAREAERYESEAARTAVAKAEAERQDMERARAAERQAAEASHAAAVETLQKTNARLTKLRAEEAGVAAALKSAADSLWPPLLDALTVEPGFEKALGAAFGDELEASSDRGAPVHWLPLEPLADAPALPEGATPLSAHVKALPELARRIAFIGIVEDDAVAASLQADLKPGQQLVSREGAVWRWDGYTMRAGAPSTAAVRLSQRNRLADIRQQIDGVVVEQTAEQARVDAEKIWLAAARDAEQTCVEQARAHERQIAEGSRRKAQEAGEATRAAERASQSTIAAAERMATQARDRHAEVARRTDQLRTRLTGIEQVRGEVTGDIADVEMRRTFREARLSSISDGQADRVEAGQLRARIAELRAALVEAEAQCSRLAREAAMRTERLAQIAQDHEGWAKRLEDADGQIVELDARREQIAAAIAELEAKPAELEAKRETLADEIDKAEFARQEAADRLAIGETRLGEADKALKQAETEMAQARESRVRREGLVEQATKDREAVVERIVERLRCEPDGVLALAEVQTLDELPELDKAEHKLERLVHERETMGAVNLRAEEEANELEQQITGMTTERDDLVAAIGRLRQGIQSLNREGRERFVAAFEQVSGHFQQLFTKLFGGGKAELRLTESEDPLEAGLEIHASPPGKKLQVMSLLSGGEQALTALSLLFAVFMTNPAPICVLDEVDAPLDDLNVERFCGLVNEIAGRTDTRFLVITHHRVTMARMDRLYGVTMAEQGVSQLVSVNLQEADRLVA